MVFIDIPFIMTDRGIKFMNNAQRIDVSSLEKAIESLAEAITEHKKNSGNKFVRDAAIQRFEYTYELSYKMLKRYLEISEPNAEEVDQMSFPNLIRTASERGLMLNGWDVWKVYRDARNATSHTYNEVKAAEVFGVIPQFLDDSKYLLTKLQESIAKL